MTTGWDPKTAWRDHWRYIVLSVDCGAGILVGAAIYISTTEAPKLRQVHLLDVTAGISIAILAVVVAAFAILAAFLTDEYMLVIKEALGNSWRAFEPYAVVAFVSGGAAFVSMVGIFLWPVAPGWAQSLVLSLAVGLSTWAVIGTVQLVGVTATHGRHRFRVPEIRAAHTKARTEHKAPS